MIFRLTNFKYSEDWLSNDTRPVWQQNLHRLHPDVLEELDIDVEKLEKILERLDEERLFEKR